MVLASVMGYGQTMQPIGQWRAFVPFAHGIQVDGSANEVMYASKFGLSSFDPVTKEYGVKTKSQGLSDLPIQIIKKDPSSQKVLVVYENGNLDLLNGDQTFNIPDIYLKQTTSAKHVYDAIWIGAEVYLSTSLGIVVVNTMKNEIKDTYKLTDNGRSLEVLSVAVNNGMLYAATSNGMQKAVFNSVSLSNPTQWSWEGSMQIQTSLFQQLITWNTDLVAVRNDSVFIKKGQNWTLMYASSLPITEARVSNQKLLLCCSNNVSGKLMVVQSPTSSPQTINLNSELFPADAIELNGSYWVADKNKGLVQINNTVEVNYTPNGPVGVAAGQTVFKQGKLIATGGALDHAGLPLNNRNGVSIFDGNGWKNFNSINTAALSQFTDIVSATIDPVSGKIFVGSYGKGIASLTQDGKISIMASNSFLLPALNNPAAFNVTGLAMDQAQNLWALCDGATQGLCVLKKDGSFKRFSIPFTYADLRLSKLLIDASQKIWIVSSHGNGLFCFNFGGTIDQLNDDKWRYFKAGSGNGNLPSANVTCIAEDRNGFMWIGTDKGIGIIQCGEDVFASNCQTTIPIVQQDNYAGPLFGDEIILDIEVDGANRKWIATARGVWLISADGQKVIHRFTTENSPLLSNHVNEIAIDPLVGEVFFMTDYGISVYRGTATEPVSEKQRPIVFPNPVPPGFNGSIAVRGLPENAWVRITELDGKLVFQTRSLGGQATWNGRNYKGEKINTGVYLVMVSDELNTYQIATKIFFIK